MFASVTHCTRDSRAGCFLLLSLQQQAQPAKVGLLTKQSHRETRVCLVWGETAGFAEVEKRTSTELSMLCCHRMPSVCWAQGRKWLGWEEWNGTSWKRVRLAGWKTGKKHSLHTAAIDCRSHLFLGNVSLI